MTQRDNRTSPHQSGPFPPTPGESGPDHPFTGRNDAAVAASDVQAVRAVMDGDPSGFALIVQRYQRPVFALLMRMVMRAEDAEDLAQETFLKAYRALDQWNPRRALRPWLYQIARNTAISSRRKKSAAVISIEDVYHHRPEALADTEADGDSLRERLDREQRLDRLRIAVSALSAEDALLYRMRFAEGLSMREIAQLSNQKEGTIAVRVHRLRERLCALCKEQEAAP